VSNPDVLIRVNTQATGSQVVPVTLSGLLGLARAQQAVTQTTAASRSGLTSFNATAFQTGGATMGGSRGIGVMRGALTSLAFEATNTAGPLGRVASTALLFAGGGALATGVVAGVAAIGLAYREATADTRAFEERTAALTKRLQELRDSRDPTAAIRRELAATRRQLGAFDGAAPGDGGGLLSRIPFLSGPPGFPRGITGSPTRGSQELQLLTGIGTELTGELGDIASEAGEKAGVAFVVAFEEKLETLLPGSLIGTIPRLPITDFATRLGTLPGFSAAGVLGGPSGIVQPPVLGREPFSENPLITGARGIALGARSPVKVMQDQVAQLNEAIQLMGGPGARGTEEFSQAIHQLEQDMAKASHTAPMLAVSIIGAVSGTIAAIASGGSAGGLLMGLGGILGMLPGLQIPGAIVAGLGAITSGVESRGVRVDEYGSRALQQMQTMERGPDVVSLVLTDSRGNTIEEIQYNIRRRERLDRQPRLPGTGLGR